MNGTQTSVRLLIDGIKEGMASVKKTDAAVCPPFIYLQEVSERLVGTEIALGAQNIFHEQAGAFTGEVSAEMLKDYNCTYVIVGHSERRLLFGETDEVVMKKFAAAQRAGLTPILCVGERLEERESGLTEGIVARQLDAVLEPLKVDAFRHAIIAYEPVWAIGTGKTATPNEAEIMHAFIRERLARANSDVAENLRILYGGSVNAANADSLFEQANVDGGLIGGASLDAEEFLSICRAAE